MQVIVNDADTATRVVLAKNALEIHEDTKQKLLDDILTYEPWISQKPKGRTSNIPRACAWYTRGNCTCSYGYAGTSWESNAFPDWLEDLTQRVQTLTGNRYNFNSANLNVYQNGNQCLGFHADDEDLFKTANGETCICSLSLGATREFGLKLKGQDDSEAFRVNLESGDVLWMEGQCQQHWQHALFRDPDVRDARINITWRILTQHTSLCEYGVPPDDAADKDM